MSKLFKHRVNATATSVTPLDTSSCFDLSHSEAQLSPIDSCFKKIENLNLIHVKFSSVPGISPEVLDTQNNLVLLGYISAVESYLREIIRKLILLDKAARISSEDQHLNYGAAVNYTSDMLPEALLEGCSFASKKNIIDNVKLFLGLKGHQPPELLTILDEFEIICQFRHCVVHRFGKLGSSNAIKLGLDKHTLCLEKPLKLDSTKLFNINLVCTNTVLVINDFLFKRILERTIEPEFSEWTWDLRSDKRLFTKYYSLFKSTIKPDLLTTISKSYNDLRDYRLKE